MKSYKCECCGAEILYNDGQNIASCLYCGNNIAIIDVKYTDLNIKKIVPFEVDREEAIENFSYYSKIRKDKIVEAKKIYLPVQFCNYEFDYLFNYEYEVVEYDEDGHSKTHYYDAEDLVDGYVKNEIIFGNSKVSDIINTVDLKAKAIDFDPAILKDVSVEYSTFESDDEVILNKLNNKIRDFSRKLFTDVTKVYSENYSLYNIDIDTYTTLIPIYIIKNNEGLIYNIPGVKLDTNKLKTFNRHNNYYIYIALIVTFFIFMGLLSTIASFAIIFNYLYLLIVIFIIYAIRNVVLGNIKGNSISEFNTISYRKISFSPDEKHIKF